MLMIKENKSSFNAKVVNGLLAQDGLYLTRTGKYIWPKCTKLNPVEAGNEMVCKPARQRSGDENDILNADLWQSPNLKTVRVNTQPQLHSTELSKAVVFAKHNSYICLG